MILFYKKKNYLYFCDLLNKNNYSFFIFSLNKKNDYINVLNNSIFHISYLNNILSNFFLKGDLYIYVYNPNDLLLNLQKFNKLCTDKE
jgi:hypothetical protein